MNNFEKNKHKRLMHRDRYIIVSQIRFSLFAFPSANNQATLCLRIFFSSLTIDPIINHFLLSTVLFFGFHPATCFIRRKPFPCIFPMRQTPTDPSRIRNKYHLNTTPENLSDSEDKTCTLLYKTHI